MAIQPWSKPRIPGGTVKEYFGDAPPSASTDGTYQRGDIVWNTAPNTGGYIGWVCVTAGTPGGWTGFGLIA
jgi:hypothetical protein